MNKFNRARCKDHTDRRLSQSHLLEQGIKIDYENIITSIRSDNWETLLRMIINLRNLEKTEEESQTSK